MKTMVIYKSRYGSSGQYASWIAEGLHCNGVNVENVDWNDLASYDVIVYVGGLYADSVNGFKQVKKHMEALRNKEIVLCMVGLTSPTEEKRYQQTFESNVPEQYRDRVKAFALQGNQLFSKMSAVHRIMMGMLKKMFEKIPAEKRTEGNSLFLEHYGEDMHFAKRENVQEIVEYVKGLAVTP